MPIVWIEEITGEVLNSGWLQGAEAAIDAAESELVGLLYASAGLIEGASFYLWGKLQDFMNTPDCIDCNDGAGNMYTFGISTSQPWTSQGDTYPPAV